MDRENPLDIAITPSDLLIYSVARISVDHATGTRVATSFFFTPYESNEFLVTNRHVVAGCERFRLRIPIRIGKSRRPAKPFEIEKELSERDWTFHPDPTYDIAVIKLDDELEQIQEEFGTEVVSTTEFAIPTNENINEIDSLEEMFFVGYPEGLQGPKTALPIIRRGFTATPFWHDFNDRPVFILGGSVFKGSSGSPVFLHNYGIYYKRGKGNVTGSRIYFMGILSTRWIQRDREGCLEIPAAGSETAGYESIDLGIVFKPELIRDTCRKAMN